MIDILNRNPADLDSRYQLSAQIPESERPVVFIGPFEHHSNELSWRESIADVGTIDEDSDGKVDLEHLDPYSIQGPPAENGKFVQRAMSLGRPGH